jgi:NAD(P)-dependent dehydrogenase (short-subunit alcohol dehydrogenase family)
MPELPRELAIVTGASTGIGLELARERARAISI